MNKLKMYKVLSNEDKDNLSIYNIYNSIYCIARNNNYEISDEEVERLEEVAHHLSESRIADFISRCYIENTLSLNELENAKWSDLLEIINNESYDLFNKNGIER